MIKSSLVSRFCRHGRHGAAKQQSQGEEEEHVGGHILSRLVQYDGDATRFSHPP